MLGKLSWEAIPFNQPIPLFAAALVGVVIIGILAWVTLKGWLPYLWREWITSVDHKRIGIMYILLAMVMLLRGFADAIMMRSQQALAFQSQGYLPPEHYNQIFSAHGTLMIFFVAMPFVIGLMNYRRAAAAWGPRRCVPDTQLGQLLAHGNRCAARQHFAGRGGVRAHRVAAVPAAVRDDLLARRRRRLLSLGDPDLRCGDLADWRQLRHDSPEDSCARHDLHAHADVLLDDARHQPADRRRLPNPHGDFGDADCWTDTSAFTSSPTKPAAT